MLCLLLGGLPLWAHDLWPTDRRASGTGNPTGKDSHSQARLSVPTHARLPPGDTVPCRGDWFRVLHRGGGPRPAPHGSLLTWASPSVPLPGRQFLSDPAGYRPGACHSPVPRGALFAVKWVPLSNALSCVLGGSKGLWALGN